MDHTTQLLSEEPLYQEIVRVYLEVMSISKTARQLHVSEVRVRKVLLTEGLWSSKTSILVQHFLDQNLTTLQIAEEMHTTVKAVQQYLPYRRGLYNGANPSAAAHYSAEYRQRIRVVQEKVLKKKTDMMMQEGWGKREETGEAGEIKEMREMKNTVMEKTIEEMLRDYHPEQYPGIVCLRELPEGYIDQNRVKARGVDVIRLHLELMRDHPGPQDEKDDGHKMPQSHYPEDDEETRVLKEYGKVSYGTTISRDILVPSDLPLFALHYAIQRLFGWQNSHLHRFELPFRQFLDVTDNNAGKWASLVGVLFRSPWMDDEDEFWADDYETGSFKTWIRKKYTGPYLSLCHGEGIFQCTEDIREIKRRYPRVKTTYGSYKGEVFIQNTCRAGKEEPIGTMSPTEDDKKDSFGGEIEKIEVCALKDCSARVIQMLFLEGGANHLLERLPIEEVLALHGRHPEDALSDMDEICDTYKSFMDTDLKNDIREILRNGMDMPDIQPMISSPTDVIYYMYDFGDGWQVRITGSLDACDLIDQGRVTQEELDEAICKVYETYRPVCIAADGLPLVDDVGGISGYVRFLRALNPTPEKEYWGKENVPDNWAYDSKQGSLEWARSLGWTDKVNVKRLL